MKALLILLSIILSSAAFATDIQLTWDAPTTRTNGTPIEAIQEYRVYETINNQVVPMLTIDAEALGHLFLNAADGLHTFQIAAVEGNLEGPASDPVSISVDAASPGKMTITVTVVTN